jgi:C4-dicarboxylate-specific signal transduction histidine kinase
MGAVASGEVVSPSGPAPTSNVAIPSVVPLSGPRQIEEALRYTQGQETEIQLQLVHANHLANIGMLAAGIGHEINNPLAALVANLEIAIRELRNIAGREDATKHVLDSTARALESLYDAGEAVDRIRQIACDLKPLPLSTDHRHGVVNLQRALDSSLRMAGCEIRRRARLVKDYGELPDVEGSEVRLGQVFLNLLMNAVHAIPEGRASEHEIRVSARIEGADWIIVEVKDTGSGIAPENVGRIFDPFFTTKAAGEGTGLGLAICQKIVTDYGGHIDVESEADKGSVFRVTLRTSHERAE